MLGLGVSSVLIVACMLQWTVNFPLLPELCMFLFGVLVADDVKRVYSKVKFQLWMFRNQTTLKKTFEHANSAQSNTPATCMAPPT